ncbi:NRDE family protein [Zhongshania aquimaris]|uniref:NRDE family protein n=1 Tax=Zhongshania aquimaris TaxID=2857107 RepID=A0ABS6VQP9_9GAMM|nr:NRDE family protein [Zhongshania aquimaris]MBW2940648.1 NRDE family protein [Zhongshania aquimaris]
MCLILLSWQNDPEHPLIVAANRDEFFQRPTLAANFWPEHPEILAGRDLEFGGSWLGISRLGRFAAVTNLREVVASGDRSRGDLVKDFLLSTQSSSQFAEQLESEKSHYRPFNFVASDGNSFCYINNVEAGWQTLAPGIYAIGNIPRSDENAKTIKGREDMSELMAEHVSPQKLLNLLQDKTPTIVSDDEIHKALSSRFVSFDGYGTRSSSIVIASDDGCWDVWEKQYAINASQQETLQHFNFTTRPNS